MTDQTPSPKSVVYVEVSGLTGSGKSAVMGEIEIALKALGLTVEHDAAFQAEKNGTHADWQEALDLYKPTVVLTERNMSRAPAPSSLAGGEVERVARIVEPDVWDMIDTLGRHGLSLQDAENVERMEFSLSAASKILAALSPEAPAREGVELDLEHTPNFGFETNEPAPRQMIEHYYRSHGMENWQRLADQYCAALTPRHEAPASHSFEASHSVHREGGCKVCGHDEASHEAPAEGAGEVVKACADFQEAIDYFEADVADALAEDSERADLWDREVTVNIDALKTVMNAALTPRHEAPADPCASHRSMGFHIDPCCPHYEAPAEGAGEVIARIEYELERAEQYESLSATIRLDDIRAALEALRARSSAREVREEALGNLLAVIHGDGGHRALEVGTKQAALEAEKIVADLLSSAPEAREVLERIREMDFKAIYGEANYQKLADDLDALYTHPAAPSADKLRIAVEALEPFANLGVSSGPDDEPCQYAYRITRGAIRNARQALAALKAEV